MMFYTSIFLSSFFKKCSYKIYKIYNFKSYKKNVKKEYCLCHFSIMNCIPIIANDLSKKYIKYLNTVFDTKNINSRKKKDKISINTKSKSIAK